MPHLMHHKRRHSWPYCGSSTHLHNHQTIPIITVTGPPDELETQFLTPVVSEDLLEDDAASAGIVRSQPTRSHHKLWHHSKEQAGHNQPIIGSGSFRKMLQPQLARARSLFVLPTAMSAGETVLLPYWIHRLSAHPITTNERGRSREHEQGRLAAIKNHRRCHSERPRSWRRPSDKLWTLQEE
ncbi:hypothetical protein BDW59DRAFT_112691 [Aspergillus cavernicola]|uniref:Uncharacterized protein n=1 Tax=Aspergillus cavernicola TaxID=176166 RepID=A0ABR4HZH9_9EURO